MFETNRAVEKLGQRSGYVLAYFSFTTVLYLVLLIFGKMPVGWSYFHAMGIALAVALVGIALRRYLK